MEILRHQPGVVHRPPAPDPAGGLVRARGPLPGAQPNQVGLELGDHGEHVEQQSADRVRRVGHRSAQVETNLARDELVGDGSGVRQRPGKPVELGDDHRVSFAASDQGFTQTWPLPVGAGQPMVDMNPVAVHAECGKARVGLSGLAGRWSIGRTR